MNLIEIVPAHSRAYRRQIRRMSEEVIPRDKSWQVVLAAAGIAALNAVALARWWVCG